MNTTQQSDTGENGLIVAHYGVAVEVFFATSNDRRTVRVKRNSGHVVGDQVIIQDEILTRLERKSELSRMDARGGVHLVGANLDILCIVVSCEPLPPLGFIDRAIVAARATGLRPVLIINKEDLPCSAAYRSEVQLTYGESLTTLSMSAITGTGLSQLKGLFSEGLRGIFVGTTGVGKSSILNGLLPALNLQTGEINETTKRGRHTTTVSTLHTLPGGGELVDSPGFNDFGLVAIDVRQLALYFPGFEPARETGCRFRDCRHRDEPDCAVSHLLAAGAINNDRYTTYLQILSEVDGLTVEPKYRVKRHRRKKSG
ncbi:MAG: ribosome small subunit-dependent GTPase A [Proteobacteria bacterium]|nr:ribosome small subunit-dependent GTPase A [Pseudomonadota bacterium]